MDTSMFIHTRMCVEITLYILYIYSYLFNINKLPFYYHYHSNYNNVYLTFELIPLLNITNKSCVFFCCFLFLCPHYLLIIFVIVYLTNQITFQNNSAIL